MSGFSQYHLNPSDFPFLRPFQLSWRGIRDEFLTFQAKASAEDKVFAQIVMGPQSKTIKVGNHSKYHALGLLFQGMSLERFLSTHAIRYSMFEELETQHKISQIRDNYFPLTSSIISRVQKRTEGLLRNVYFGTFDPGLEVRLHINDNPHMNRGYLGLIVPRGDVGMKICHETLRWHDGEFLVLDHSFPHCPHNRTNESRTVLVVDFFKTNMPKVQATEIEREQVATRLADNPYSLGVFGPSDKAKVEDFHRYGMAHQLNWNESLSS
jgi:aspartyl/asparaginyl beta-hydroxylase (cupin superfamily)